MKAIFRITLVLGLLLPVVGIANPTFNFLKGCLLTLKDRSSFASIEKTGNTEDYRSMLMHLPSDKFTLGSKIVRFIQNPSSIEVVIFDPQKPNFPVSSFAIQAPIQNSSTSELKITENHDQTFLYTFFATLTPFKSGPIYPTHEVTEILFDANMQILSIDHLLYQETNQRGNIPIKRIQLGNLY